MTVAEKQAWVNEQRDKIIRRFSGDKNSREPLHTVSSTRELSIAPFSLTLFLTVGECLHWHHNIQPPSHGPQTSRTRNLARRGPKKPRLPGRNRMHDPLLSDAHRSLSSTLVVADEMLPRVARVRHHPIRTVEPAPSQGRRQGVARSGAKRGATLGFINSA